MTYFHSFFRTIDGVLGGLYAILESKSEPEKARVSQRELGSGLLTAHPARQ